MNSNILLTLPPVTRSMAAAFVLGVLPSQAATILGTGFDGTATSTSMTGITWTQTGLAAAPSSTLGTSNGLLTGSNTGSHLVGNLNIGDTGNPWSLTVDFTTGGLGINLSDIDIEGTNFNSSGTWQQNLRSLGYTVDILDASDSVIGTLTDATPEFGSNTGNGTNSFDVGGLLRSYQDNYAFASAIALSANTDYKLRISVFEGTNQAGNFGGINSFSLNGSVIPEPSAALLGGLGMLCLLRRRR